MTSRERRGQLGKGKTDPVDAFAIARITAHDPTLPPVRLTIGPAADLRALLDYRDDLVVNAARWSTGPRRAERSGTRLPAPDPHPGHPGPGPPGSN